MSVKKSRDILYDWIISNRDLFSFRSPRDELRELELLKPFGEFVLCLDILLDNPLNDIPELNTLLSWAWEQLDEGAYITNILMSNPDLILLSSIYSVFHKRNLKNAHLHSLITKLGKCLFVEGLQYPNWRRLDLQRAFQEMNIGVISDEVIENTWCCLKPEPWIVGLNISYALTHEVFYLTDFGRDASLLPEHSADYISLWTPVWLEIYSEAQNWDIFSELLMVLSCLKKDSQALPYFSNICNEIESHGYLPGPKDGGKNLMLDDDPPHFRSFLNKYHTNLVGLMACDMYLALSG